MLKRKKKKLKVEYHQENKVYYDIMNTKTGKFICRTFRQHDLPTNRGWSFNEAYQNLKARRDDRHAEDMDLVLISVNDTRTLIYDRI